MAPVNHPTPTAGRRSGLVGATAGGLLLLALALPLHAEDSLKNVFTDAEYRQAGLDKLSPDEQAALMQALQKRGLWHVAPPALTPVQPTPAPVAAAVPGTPAPVATAPASVSADAPSVPKKGLWARIKDFGAEQLPIKSDKDEGEVTEIEAQMIEPFTGLRGRTLFHLDNGQIWQQRITETYYIGQPISNPKVTLKRTRFGYRLGIPAVGASFDVSVKRIK
jgi:hypothetical protein